MANDLRTFQEQEEKNMFESKYKKKNELKIRRISKRTITAMQDEWKRTKIFPNLVNSVKKSSRKVTKTCTFESKFESFKTKISPRSEQFLNKVIIANKEIVQRSGVDSAIKSSVQKKAEQWKNDHFGQDLWSPKFEFHPDETGF